MLPANPTASPAPPESPVSAARRASTPWPTILAVVLMLYALAMGWGLIGGSIPPERSYLLMAMPCLVPMLWCFAGALRGLGSLRDAGEQDTGLWVSGAGWLLLFFGLIVKHVAVMRALPDAYAADASSPLTPLFVGLGVLALLGGAAISWLAWNSTEN